MTQAGFVIAKFGLDSLGLKNLGTVQWNLTVPALYEEAIRRGEGQLDGCYGACFTDDGQFALLSDRGNHRVVVRRGEMWVVDGDLWC